MKCLRKKNINLIKTKKIKIKNASFFRMFKIIILAITISIVSCSPVAREKQFGNIFGNLANNLAPALFPELFPNRQTINNNVLNQIKPFVDPLSNVVQPMLNPVLKPVNQNVDKYPIVGVVVNDCTGNALNCLLNSIDKTIQ